MLKKACSALGGGRTACRAAVATLRTVLVTGLVTGLVVLWAAPAALATPALTPALTPAPEQAAQQEQVLVWTANDSVTEYASVPTTAVAGPATIVFENSVETGNTTGMPHTLTFDTTTPGYNHDVDVDILANPFDANGGRYEVQVVLSPGTYYYFCNINGHTMNGELVVTEGGEDTTPPGVSASVTGDRNEAGEYVGAATVSVSAQDTESGVALVEYELDGGGFGEYSGPVTVTEPGVHTVGYRATDNAGNTSEPGSVTFTVVEPPQQDTTPPEVSAEVSGEQNEAGEYVGAAMVSLSAEDAGSGVDTVEYSLDGAGYAAYTGPVEVSQPGAHMVSYRATDNAGNTSEPGMIHFTVVERDGGGDACPDSDTRDTVIIDGQDTGVQNADTGDGCTISDLIAADAAYASHGAFVEHVDAVTDQLMADGAISGREKGRIMRTAARSDIGKTHGLASMSTSASTRSR